MSLYLGIMTVVYIVGILIILLILTRMLVSAHKSFGIKGFLIGLIILFLYLFSENIIKYFMNNNLKILKPIYIVAGLTAAIVLLYIFIAKFNKTQQYTILKILLISFGTATILVGLAIAIITSNY